MAAVSKMKADALASLLDRVPSHLATDLEATSSIKHWLQMYKAMGLKPKKVKPTHYALSLRLLKDKQWPRSIGPLVDTYLCNQINHLLPHGGFDVEKLSGDTIKLLVSDREYSFQQLGDDETKMQTTKPGEVLYQDCTNTTTLTLTRYLNYRDAEPTKIVDDAQDESRSTKDFVLIIEGIDGTPEGKAQFRECAKDLERAYRLVYGEYVLQSFVRFVELGDKGEEAVLCLDF